MEKGITNMVAKKEIEDFIEELGKVSQSDFQKAMFMSEHNFKREQAFHLERHEMLQEIMSELQSVLSGRRHGAQVKFHFNH